MARKISTQHYSRILQVLEAFQRRLLVKYNYLVVSAVHLIVLTNCHVVSTSLVIPNQPPLRYIRRGDLYIGGIISGLAYSANDACGNTLFVNTSFHFSEAIAFAIDEVNNNEYLLPNLTLGFVILDDCMKESTAAIQAISFIKEMNTSLNSDLEECATNETCMLLQEEKDEHDVLQTYDVVGVIGCLRSSSSAAASLILGPAQVPLISFTSTSETLNNKELYPYFMRVVPSDGSLVDVQMKLIHDLGWRYISVVYDEGDFGESAFQALRQVIAASNEKVCIATSHKIYQKSTYEEYQWIMKDLITHKNARVVIAYVDPPSVTQILKANDELAPKGWFIWLGNDSWKHALGDTSDEVPKLLVSMCLSYYNVVLIAENETDFQEMNIIRSAAGCLVAGFKSVISPAYNQHLLQMDPSNSVNPWFARFWSDTFKCPLVDPSCVSANNLSSLPGLSTFTYANNALEAVLTYAHGIQSVVDNKCINLTTTDIKSCIKGPDLLQAMKRLEFRGPTGLIEFDQQGSVLAKFHVEQIIPDSDYRSFNVTPVAIFYSGKSKIHYLRNISFDYIIQDGFVDGVPESLCSKPCGPGQFIIPKELVCCWECRTCRNNEILVNDFKDCFPCPIYEWPDPQSNFTICEPIVPDYLQSNHPFVVVCLVLAAVGIVLVTLVTWAFFRYRNVGIIKASGRELNYVQLIAILSGYLTMPVLTVKPSAGVCNAAFFMYCLSLTWLYAPLLVKAIRIHRIFTSGKRSKAKVKFISPTYQIVFTFLLILVQLFLCIIAAITFKPGATLTQPVRTVLDYFFLRKHARTETLIAFVSLNILGSFSSVTPFIDGFKKYVELSCDWTFQGHGSFLVYNIVLLSLCSVLAFKTRKLPDNFNESKFITFCVYTTLVIWAAFIPAYFTHGPQSVKTLLLALSLMVNHTVVVVCLYLPKLYAAVNLIPTTSISSCSVDDNTRRGSGVSSVHNTRFLSGLSEVLSALRLSPATGKSTTGNEEDNGSVEFKRSTHDVSPRITPKLNLSRVTPFEHPHNVDLGSSSSV